MGKAQPQEDRILFWVRREGGPQYGGRAYYAARQGDFKLLQNSPFEPMELYNLKDDPKEQKPLGRKHPMYNKLFTALQAHITPGRCCPLAKVPGGPEADADPLLSLGYSNCRGGIVKASALWRWLVRTSTRPGVCL